MDTELSGLLESHPLAQGMIMIDPQYKPCLASWCPPDCSKDPGACPWPGGNATSAYSVYTMANMRDAVVLMARALQPSLVTGDGGQAYANRNAAVRHQMMRELRVTRLGVGEAASGALRFSSVNNNRIRENFVFSFLNVRKEVTSSSTAGVGGGGGRGGGGGGGGGGGTTTKYIHTVGHVIMASPTSSSTASDGSTESTAAGGAIGDQSGGQFIPEPGTKIVWPGSTFIMPDDVDRHSTAPRFAVLGWVEHPTGGDEAARRRIEEYAHHVVDVINNSTETLAYTHLRLDIVPAAASGRSRTTEEYVDACEALAERTRAANATLLGFLGVSSGRSRAILNSRRAALKGVPVFGYFAASPTLGNATRYPNFVRVYISDAQRGPATLKILDYFEARRVLNGVRCMVCTAYGVACMCMR